MIPTPVPEELILFAGSLADAAGTVAMQHFRRNTPVETKADHSPVTIADREVEQTIRTLIAAHYPGHGVIGEEQESAGADRDLVWVIDPIDGTQSFIVGSPLFGTLIALTRGGAPILGVIDHPALGQRWVGAQGHPTLFNGAPVRVTTGRAMADATVLTSSPHYFSNAGSIASFGRLRAATRFTSYGTECHAYGLLASGFNDVVIEAGMEIFDYLAAVPVVEGAGGIISDWAGQPLTITSGDKVLATASRTLHAAALEILA